MHLKGMQQEGKLSTPLSLRGRDYRGFRVALRWGCGVWWCAEHCHHCRSSQQQGFPNSFGGHRVLQGSSWRDQCLQFVLARSAHTCATDAPCLRVFPTQLEEMPFTLLALLLAILQPRHCLAPILLWLWCGAQIWGAGCSPDVAGGAQHVQLCSVSLSRNESLGGFFLKLFLSSQYNEFAAAAALIWS